MVYFAIDHGSLNGILRMGVISAYKVEDLSGEATRYYEETLRAVHEWGVGMQQAALWKWDAEASTL